MSLDNIPDELLPLIAQYLEPDELYSWTLTARRFYVVLIAELYSIAVSRDEEELGWSVSLILAAASNQNSAFKALLKRTKQINGANINVDLLPGDHDWLALKRKIIWATVHTSLLHVVCHLGNDDMIRLVMAHGADSSVCDSSGWTPLHLAAMWDNATATRSLIASGADVNIATRGGGEYHELPSRALHHAIMARHPRIWKLLLEAGADPSAEYDESEDSLCLAAQYGDVALVRHLLAGYDFAHQSVTNALSYAARNDDPLVGNALLNAGAAVSDVALFQAARSDNIPMIKLLIDAGTDVTVLDSMGYNVLYNVQSAAAAQLVLNEAPGLATSSILHSYTLLDRLYRDDNLVHRARDCKTVPLALLLIQKGSRVSVSDSYPHRNAFHAAAQVGHITVVNAILERQGSVVTSRDSDGSTALHQAAIPSSAGKLSCVKALVEFGSDVHALTDERRSALHHAYGKPQWGMDVPDSEIEAVTKYLIEAGVDTSIQSLDGNTALHEALTHDQPTSALILLDAGVNISAVNRFGETALHLAAEKGYVEVFKRLIKKDGSISARTAKGDTVLHLAAREGARRHNSIEGYVKMVACILLGHDNISVQAVGGQVGLEPLSKTGHMEIIRLFCNEAGQDVLLQNNKGFTAWDIVKQRAQEVAWSSLEPTLGSTRPLDAEIDETAGLDGLGDLFGA
ncbi:hypothetical protein ASPWEDRAFT_148048 [Aspergillus wentii DTO 134E9]|uniref:F-box domain-containing protein n=1 Tax=Aspergillus wentii DTO 134E9 TaxID=1073089 RepID=A0A1L9S492_ASPWE|nr:uncharacterized protein ASPWEDRAFT_148048 [Aspergillus wentii DTO 134E9]KAI9930280.1 hypothetical protein MW887_012093 [Aspergillus wentii]OJJ41957.1 hypothetical protein ASPWEDRAFT_148048 [Aspergillus wentii DTO 134E9]